MISDTYGLSPMQQGMLYHTLCDPHAGLGAINAIDPNTQA
jgi:hypothetical protein